MEYIIFDLEFNQGFNATNNKTVANEKCPFEIIQIGAIKLNSNFEYIDSFNSFVKPTIYDKVHPFISNMTKITNSDVKDAPNFISVYKNFKKFIGNTDNILCVWGTGDLKELYRNIYYYGLPFKTLPKSYINIQHHASVYFKNPSGKSIGLQNAIQMLHIEQNKSYHDALNDAYYTTEVFKRIYTDSIKPDTYIYTPVKPKTVTIRTKRKVDYDALFSEFEKILKRELSNEDKKIIELAYKMGKTKQFAIDNPKMPQINKK